MDLDALSEDAQDVASVFLVFQDYLHVETAADLSELATELFGLKTALLDLDAECRDPRNRRAVEVLDEEQYVVVKSLEYTFKDIHRHFGNLARPGYRSKREAYRAVWRELDEFFYDESSNRLVVRLGYYKTFIIELTEVVIGHRPHPKFEELFERIDRLLEVQEEGHLPDELDQLALGTPRPVRSWERRRPYGPYGLDRHGQPNGRGPPRDQDPNRRPGPRPPLVPAFPLGGLPLSPVVSASSPPSTVTTSSVTASSSTSSTMPNHWLADIWSQNRTSTPFITTGPESACFGEPARGASRKLREEHVKLITLPMEQIEVRIYLRERDRRARILCRTERRNNGHIESVEPVSKLRILRKDSCLRLCKPDARRRLRLWATLRFIAYERLVLFYCSFLALKAQESAEQASALDDHILDGEMTIFSSKIHDNNYIHALQIFKDADSGGIRLQASVLRGPMKRAPVWTAFIKYSLSSPDWISQREPKKVLLADLSRYIFTEDYEPQMAPTGEHELAFMNTEDADKFVATVFALADGEL